MQLATRGRQVQRQALSPQMWMGLNLLALPIDDLREEVRKEVESNPAIEDVAFAPPPRPPSSSRAADFVFENQVKEESLEEHLLKELGLSDVDGAMKTLCEAVVANIDADGRFVGSIPDMVMTTGASEAEIERARRIVMTLDPLGCGAQNLAECFEAQLEKIPQAKRAEAKAAIAALAKMLENPSSANPSAAGISPGALKLLRTLDPRPGRQYASSRVEYVTADIAVDGEGEVEVERGEIPEIRISPRYVEMAKDPDAAADVRAYAAERVRRARDFKAALEKRFETLERIANVAVASQREFLRKGRSALKPLTMTEVAKKAKCHVATVSRAANRKYVRTPRGLFRLREFFTLVDQAPVEALRRILQEAERDRLAGRMPGAPSDREIAARMAAAGFPMARRTVNKYRAKLGFRASKEMRGTSGR